MNKAEAQKAVDDLRVELALTEKRLLALHKLIDGYKELFPGLTVYPDKESDDSTPKGQDAVRRVLMDSPGKWFTVPAMVNEIEARGWAPDSEDPPNAIRTALTRLQASDSAHINKGSTGDGAVAYRYVPTLRVARPGPRRRVQDDDEPPF